MKTNHRSSVQRNQWIQRLFGVFVLCALHVGLFGTLGCFAQQATSRLELWEGPHLQHGRMSATLGGVNLPDGRIMIVGGSPSEYPFAPHEGTKAIEIADPKCILAPECVQAKTECKCWYEAGIPVPYPLAGFAYLLPDGRVIVFASVFVFDPDSTHPEPAPETKNDATSGPISAAIIDLANKTVTPIYRPKGNIAGNPPVTGNGPALLQRVFDRSLQLRDGRIVRIGGELRYTGPTPEAQCKENRCIYCVRDKCNPGKQAIACDKAEECPKQDARWDKILLADIEIYTPPDGNNPLGSVQYLKMDEGRSSVGAIELEDGRVLITGGWGPQGDGSNQDYLTTYFLHTERDKPTLSYGPRMLFYREDHAMAMLKDGRILITGGTNEKASTVNTSEIFDPKLGVFMHGPLMTLTREDHVSMLLGPWLLFLGGEVNDKADQIRNTAEIFDASSGAYIGPVFMFSRPVTGDDQGFAGVTDFATFQLDPNTIMLAGGQQGLQDQDGEFISGGKGSRRSLVIRYRP